MTTTDTNSSRGASRQATSQLVEAQRETLQQGRDALASRSYFSRYPESPSPRIYGETAAADGLVAFEAHLASDFSALGYQPTGGAFAGTAMSPSGPELLVRYTRLGVAEVISAASHAQPPWHPAGP